MDASVEIPESSWRRTDEIGSRLITTLVVNGWPMHLEAIEVSIGGGRLQQASGATDETFAAVHSAVGADGPWETLSIGGREYVLIGTPYC